MGCMRTIKNLERENLAKSDKISSLTLELEKKTKQIENLLSEKAAAGQQNQRQQLQQAISANSKKRERELEARLKDQD